MGEDKALLPIHGEPMIQHIQSALSSFAGTFILSVAPGETTDLPGMIAVPDKAADCGPLMGICSALSASSTDLNIVAACDIPCIRTEVVETLLSRASGREIVAPSFQSGLPEPLLGVYRKSVAVAAERLLADGVRKVSALFDVCSVEIVPFESSDWYFNLNTREEYERWIRRAAAPVKGD